MGMKKSKKKKVAKLDPLADEKAYLTNVINKMEECAAHNKGNDLEAYFKSKADLNRERLKALK